MSAVLLHLESVLQNQNDLQTAMADNQIQTLNSLNQIGHDQTQMTGIQNQTLNTLNQISQTQIQMATTFNQVATLMQVQSQQLQNMSSTMSSMVSLLENQQETLQNISKSLPYQTDVVTREFQMQNSILRLNFAHDCSELAFTHPHSGIYTISPVDGLAMKVYCHMDTAGYGWIVFQRRYDGSVDFYRNWDDYVEGFGTVDGEFWMGLHLLQKLTSSGTWELKILLEDFNGGTAYANYPSFSIGDAASNYTLHIGAYSGTAGDSLSYNNNKPFSTKDRDNDRQSSFSCAQRHEGAWWHGACTHINLNGKYLGATGNRSTAMFWHHWTLSLQSLKSSMMMFRRIG
ncbi:fibrinogen-like protein A [Amphiura filiformis]|uniref:fibrinogen-like protein A n=1 Tax=Amphiura filiformis TaxID=82378 RepID=UPI003B20CA4A